jgi:hypothetical protein
MTNGCKICSLNWSIWAKSQKAKELHASALDVAGSKGTTHRYNADQVQCEERVESVW